MRLSDSVAEESMTRAGLIPLVPYPGNVMLHWKAECRSCGSQVAPRLNDIRNGDGGCRACYRRRNVGAGHRNWTGDRGSYRAVHARLRESRGPASGFSCVDCHQPAREWSYVGDSNGEIKPYSTDLADYEPRCTPCHRLRDIRLRTVAP